MTPHFNSHRREGATAGSLAGREQFDVAPPGLLENRVATEERSRHSRHSFLYYTSTTFTKRCV
jgi:hypothetical protein